jgi:Ca2+/Na+ antiporter
MEQLLKTIFQYATSILSLIVFLCTALVFVINQIKKKHKRVEAEDKAEALQEELDDEQARFKLLNELLPLAISKAEATPLINGMTKKMLAMSEILLNCNALKIPFEKFKDFISEQVDNLIDFTKVINAREKDKEAIIAEVNEEAKEG